MFTAFLAMTITQDPGLVAGQKLMPVFRAVCMDGESKFRASEIKEVSFNKLPAEARKKLSGIWMPTNFGTKSSPNKLLGGQYFQLLEYEGKNYLAIEQRQMGNGNTRRICALIASKSSISDAASYLDPNFDPASVKPFTESVAGGTFSQRPLRWFKASSKGHYLSAHNLPGKYTLVQSVITDENEKEKLNNAVEEAVEKNNQRQDGQNK